MQYDKDYQELRKLLLAPEQDALDKIQEDIKQSRDSKVTDVAEVLSDSLRLSTKNDKTLSQSLQPAVEDCIQQSVKQDAQFFADILFPIMGPAIRKSIADALKEVVDSINRAMEQSFSKQAMKWRWQSFTTGKSYGEIVLKNTLLYRVDQVFLINRESGLLMQYTSHPDWQKGKDKMDSDAISAMLTAIQDFMHDSFNVQESDRLDSIDMGDSTVLLSHGPKATLACKVRGNAGHDIKSQMQEVLEDIHLNYFRDMEEFNGDRRSMQATIPLLQSLLLEKKKQAETKKQRSFFTSPFFFIFLLLLLALIAFSGWRYWESKKFNSYVAKLDQMPGVLITDAGRRGGRFWVKGLQDPISDINQLVDNKQIDTSNIDYQFTAYQSLEPEVILARAIKKLQIPATIDVQYEANILLLAGSLEDQKDIEWYQGLSFDNIYLAGVERIDSSAVTVKQPKPKIEDFLKENSALINAINETVFYFLKADVLQAYEQAKFAKLIDNMTLLDEKVAASPWEYTIVLTGYSDISGSQKSNDEIRLKRANYIRNTLLENNRFNLQVRVLQSVSTDGKRVDYKNRKVTLEVIVK